MPINTAEGLSYYHLITIENQAHFLLSASVSKLHYSRSTFGYNKG